MGSDFLAAKKEDVLIHSSLLADFVSAVVKGAVYAGVAIGAAAAATAIIGTGGTGALVAGYLLGGLAVAAVGYGLGGLIDKVSDAAGDAADAVLDFFNIRGSPDGLIITGSPNVNIKGKPAARAAGKLPAASELDRLEAVESKEENIALDLAGSIFFALVPGADLANSVWNFICDPIGSLQEMVAPTVAGANPYAEPADMDKITCEKFHAMPASELFLAEGSRTVHINSQPACRNGDRSTCEAVISHTQTGPKVRIGGPAEVVRDIRSGKNPFVGLAADLLVAVLARKVINKFRKTGNKEPHPDDVCPLGNPVHGPSGAKVQLDASDRDFLLQGRIPLIWQRLYNSRNTVTGMLGCGWRLPCEVFICRDTAPDTITPPQFDLTEKGPEQFFYVDDAGRALKLGGLVPGDSAFYIDEGFRVWRSKQDYFLLQTLEGEYSFFAPDPVQPGRWRLEKWLDRHLNALTLVYDHSGVLTHIHDDAHLLVVRLRHEQGRLRAVYQQSERGDSEKLLVSYAFTPTGQLAQVADADENVLRRFEYGVPHGLMVSQFYSGGREAHYRWQQFDAWTDETGQVSPAHWRVVEHWIQAAAQKETPAILLEHYQFEYDVADRRLRVVQKDKGETLWRWDGLEQITLFVDEYGGVWKNVWNDSRELLSSTDPLGHTEHWSYDDWGNVSVYTDALDNKTRTTYLPGFSFPLVQTLPGDARWKYRHNAAGDLISVTDPLGHETRYEWSEEGDNTAIHDAAGNVFRYRCNDRGMLTEYEDCSGRVTRWRYDEWGQLTHEVNAAGNITRYGYNGRGLLQSLTRPDGSTLRAGYDGAGALIRHEGFDRQVTTFSRNARGQVVSRTDPAGHRIQFRYDGPGRLTQLINEKGEAYRFEYDARDALVRETDISGREKVYRRDAAGRVVMQTETPTDGGEPQVTGFEYDALNRLTARITAARRVDYEYGLRQITLRETTAEGMSVLRFDYDSLGQLTAEHNHGGIYRHEYDPTGNLTAVHYPDGRTLRHLYYGSGHLLETRLDSEHGSEVVAAYTRDRLHREVSRTQGRLTQYREYDVCGRLRRQSSGHKAPQLMTPLTDCIYHHDSGDHIRRLSWRYGQEMPWTRTGGIQEESFSYDPRGQVLRHWQDEHREDFAYDGAMNLLAGTGAEAPLNRLTAGNGYRYTWDGFGRLSGRERIRGQIKQRLDYDDAHRLVRVEIQNDPVYRRVEYGYDALGRRTEKRVWRHGLDTPDTTVFAWQGMRLCGEHNAGTPGTETLYLYEEGSHIPQARVDSRRYGGRGSQTVYYYHTLVNGRPQCMTDAEGRIVWHERMQLWGGSTYEDNSHYWHSSHPWQNLRFAGQYLDRETGLHYNTLRYYAPESGRFTTPDPIGLKGGLNLYQYAPNPLSWIDPLGLFGCDPKAQKHILHGDGPGSGGHMWPGQPGKTTFPQSWDGKKIISEVDDIVNSPSTKWYAQQGTGGALTKSGKAATWVAWEVRDGVQIRVVYQPAKGRIVTAFPDSGPVPRLPGAK